MPHGCKHVNRKIGPEHPLAGKTVYLPTMAEGSADAFAAVFRWLGVNATPTPPASLPTGVTLASITIACDMAPEPAAAGLWLLGMTGLALRRRRRA